MRLAEEALQAQGLEEELISQTLERLTQPVECPGTEICTDQKNGQAENALSPSVKRKAEACVDTTGHLLHSSSKGPSGGEELSAGAEDEGEGENCPEAKRPRRQGDPLYDPLATLYSDEPEPLDQKALSQVRCLRHDDWIVHCGCRLRESQLEAAPLTKADVQGAEYVLVEEQEDTEESESGQKNVSARGEMLFMRSLSLWAL